ATGFARTRRGRDSFVLVAAGRRPRASCLRGQAFCLGVMENCMRTWNLLLLFVSAASVHAAEPKIHRDLPYADTKNKLQTLDVYAPPEGTSHPVAIWIHGGGWHSGDKSEMDNKP